MTTHALGSACRAVSQFWDTVVEEFLADGRIPESVEPWASSYQGKGKGVVDRDALPELFLGPLTKPRAVFLALNPGKPDPRFHHRGGIFVHEIREKGSYSAWAASWPYLRDPWVSKNGRNSHHRRRLRFLRDWIDNPELPCSAMVSFELYPWHSHGITAPIGGGAAREFIQEHVWEPVKELGVPIFAFGAPWFSILKRIPELKVVRCLGNGGIGYGSSAKTRSVIVLQGGGLTVIAEKHSGSAGPPSRDETMRLREALDDFCR
ncbi:MAG: hypothetical protein OXI64_06245 [Defluviicoccus sp.]|nr:hypothetical protein [Defluviicoccus sp.]